MIFYGLMETECGHDVHTTYAVAAAALAALASRAFARLAASAAFRSSYIDWYRAMTRAWFRHDQPSGSTPGCAHPHIRVLCEMSLAVTVAASVATEQMLAIRLLRRPWDKHCAITRT